MLNGVEAIRSKPVTRFVSETWVLGRNKAKENKPYVWDFYSARRMNIKYRQQNTKRKNFQPVKGQTRVSS